MKKRKAFDPETEWASYQRWKKAEDRLVVGMMIALLIGLVIRYLFDMGVL